TILEKRPGVTEYNYYLRLDNGYLRFSFYNAAHFPLLDSTTKLSQDTWHHVVATYDQSDIRLYVDGIQVASTAQTAALVPDTGSLIIGIETYGGLDKGFDGTIDEVRISSSARDADWIQTTYNNVNNPVNFISLGTEENSVTAPVVSGSAATNVEETTATGNADMTDRGNENADLRGFVWNTVNSFPSSTNWTESGSFGTGVFTGPITSLSPGTLYYYRGFARNSAGIGYGASSSFLTKPLSVTGFSATINGADIDLAWTKGTGSTHTLIYVKTDTYPTSIGDGTQVYDNTGVATTYSPGAYTTLYFTAFAQTINVYTSYSDAPNAQAMVSSGGPVTAVGGTVQIASKVLILIPWIGMSLVFSLLVVGVIIRVRRKSNRPPPGNNT
ncbi:MAG: LamG domain-containing protein, partial [Dehalococcoidales bacterium]|nr:LamG domain-containing protein [Dehalococcoidales bacterium]